MFSLFSFFLYDKKKFELLLLYSSAYPRGGGGRLPLQSIVLRRFVTCFLGNSYVFIIFHFYNGKLTIFFFVPAFSPWKFLKKCVRKYTYESVMMSFNRTVRKTVKLMEVGLYSNFPTVRSVSVSYWNIIRTGIVANINQR